MIVRISERRVTACLLIGRVDQVQIDEHFTLVVCDLRSSDDADKIIRLAIPLLGASRFTPRPGDEVSIDIQIAEGPAEERTSTDADA